MTYSLPFLRTSFTKMDMNWNLQANASSEMAVNDGYRLKFLDLKSKRTYSYITYKIEDQHVTIDKIGGPMRISQILYLLMNAAMLFLTFTLPLIKAANKIRFSSLPVVTRAN